MTGKPSGITEKIYELVSVVWADQSNSHPQASEDETRIPYSGRMLIVNYYDLPGTPLPSIIGFISPINLSLFTILRRTILIDSSGKPDSSVTV